MRCETKVWGTTTELFSNGTCSAHYLNIKHGGYCSQHRHRQKENIFYIVRGTLAIYMWENKDDRLKRVLHAGDYFTITTGVWHMFEALTDVECVEIYEYCYDGMDIERRTQGGMRAHDN